MKTRRPHPRIDQRSGAARPLDRDAICRGVPAGPCCLRIGSVRRHARSARGPGARCGRYALPVQVRGHAPACALLGAAGVAPGASGRAGAAADCGAGLRCLWSWPPACSWSCSFCRRPRGVRGSVGSEWSRVPRQHSILCAAHADRRDPGVAAGRLDQARAHRRGGRPFRRGVVAPRSMRRIAPTILPLFVALWYSLGIAIVALVGGLAPDAWRCRW